MLLEGMYGKLVNREGRGERREKTSVSDAAWKVIGKEIVTGRGEYVMVVAGKAM